MRENQCAVIRMEYNDPEWLIDMIKFIGCNYTQTVWYLQISV